MDKMTDDIEGGAAEPVRSAASASEDDANVNDVSSSGSRA